jgi:hypothetical protein
LVRDGLNRQGPARPARNPKSAVGGNVRCLKTLRSRGDFELHARALVQRAISFRLNRGEVHEHILACLSIDSAALDESVTLGRIKPFNCTLFSLSKPRGNITAGTSLQFRLSRRLSGPDKTCTAVCNPAATRQKYASSRMIRLSGQDFLGTIRRAARRRYNFCDLDKHRRIDRLWVQYSLAVSPRALTTTLAQIVPSGFQNGNKNAKFNPGGLFAS